jgi:hypothetical protein
MKKTLLLLAIAALVFSLTAKAQIEIDAQRDAWYDQLTGPENGKVFLPSRCYLRDIGSSPDNDEDLSAVVWFSHDYDYMYVYVEVKDDIVSVSNTSTWLNDNIELKFDPDPNAGEGTGTSNSRLTALGEGDAEEPTGVDNLNGSGHLENAEGEDYVPAEDDYARRLTEDGYALEFRVPFEYINEPEDNRFMVEIEEGAVFGMAINLGDNDTGDRNHMLQWSAGHTDEAHSYGKYHGTVTILADDRIKLEAVSPRDPLIENDSADAWYNDPNPVMKVAEYISMEQAGMSNYPNPFNSETKIMYRIDRAETATIAIFSMTGRLIRNLSLNQLHQPGLYEILWNGRNDCGHEVSSGTYFYKLITPTRVEINKMMFLK